MKIKKRGKTPEPHIPFIALADIAWQLIIFFLVAASFPLITSLNLDIPAASKQAATPQAQPAKTITVRATATQVLVDGKPIPLPDLQAHVAALLAGRKTEQDRAVMIEGKDDLTFQQDTEIMYAIQKAGGVLVMQEDK